MQDFTVLQKQPSKTPHTDLHTDLRVLFLILSCNICAIKFHSGPGRFGPKLVFFLRGFPFTNIHDSQDSRGRAISLTLLYHFHPLHKHLDISRGITADSSLCT